MYTWSDRRTGTTDKVTEMDKLTETDVKDKQGRDRCTNGQTLNTDGQTERKVWQTYWHRHTKQTST